MDCRPGHYCHLVQTHKSYTYHLPLHLIHYPQSLSPSPFPFPLTISSYQHLLKIPPTLTLFYSLLTPQHHHFYHNMIKVRVGGILLLILLILLFLILLFYYPILIILLLSYHKFYHNKIYLTQACRFILCVLRWGAVMMISQPFLNVCTHIIHQIKAGY